MPGRERTALLIAFTAAFTVAALGMYWNQLEARHGFPAGTRAMLLMAVIAAATARIAGKTRALATIIAVGMALPAGVLAVFLIALIKDPGSGNLWPLAVFVISVSGLLASSAGTALGSMILRIAGRAPP